MKTTNLVLQYFNAAVPTKNDVTYNTVGELGIKTGYLIDPALSNTEVLKWLKTKLINYNATFYKEWADMISKNRFELFIDQIRHYLSTYGTGHQGEPFIPNDGQQIMTFTQFKVIVAITKEELITRIEKMFFSGVALSEATILDLFAILDELGHTIDGDQVKNKEAKMFVYKQTHTVPKDPIEFVRFLVYLATGKTMVIKNQAQIKEIKDKGMDIYQLVKQFGDVKLSSVYYRFKKIFIAFAQSNRNNKSIVNRLSNLAKKHHVPMQIGYFENLLAKTGNHNTTEILLKKLSEINNYKKVKLLQAISIRMMNLETRPYVVRNQKLYIKQESRVALNSNYVGYLTSIYVAIYTHLIETLAVKHKGVKVKLPTNLVLTLPTSEKSFVGNLPLGSSIQFPDSNAIVGVHWRGDEGANDLDLSLVDIDGTKYGWNAAYKNANNSIIYSGDMTSANPEAVELFYAAKGFKPALVRVNLYSGRTTTPKFRFFVANEEIPFQSDARQSWSSQRRPNIIPYGHMVDPNNILTQVESQFVEGERQKILGVIDGEKFIVAQFKDGKGRVSYQSTTDLYTEWSLKTLDSYIDLNKVVADAGIEVVEEDADIDFSNLSKDTLISFLS